MGWQTKLLNKEQEINLITERYEKKLQSMQAELEERDANLEQSRDMIAELDEKFKNVSSELYVCDTKRQRLQVSYEKYSNMCLRL